MSDFEDEVLDRLRALGDVRARRMFGGLGLSRGTAFFAIVWRDALYFKVDDRSRSDFERAGMEPFHPFADKPAMRGYYEVPPRILEAERELRAWAERAISVADARKTARRKSGRHDKLRNLGPVSRGWLAEIEVHSRADLERLGSVGAFRALRKRRGAVSLNLLYALEAALLDVHWMRLPQSLKRDLRAAAGVERRRS